MLPWPVDRPLKTSVQQLPVSLLPQGQGHRHGNQYDSLSVPSTPSRKFCFHLPPSLSGFWVTAQSQVQFWSYKCDLDIRVTSSDFIRSYINSLSQTPPSREATWSQWGLWATSLLQASALQFSSERLLIIYRVYKCFTNCRGIWKLQGEKRAFSERTHRVLDRSKNICLFPMSLLSLERKYFLLLLAKEKKISRTCEKYYIMLQSYVLRQMHIKTTMGYHYTPVSMARIQNTDIKPLNVKCWRGCGAGGLSLTAGEVARWYRHLGSQFSGFL